MHIDWYITFVINVGSLVQRRMQDFWALLDNLENVQDLQRRRELLEYLEQTRIQLVRMLVIIKWLGKSASYFKRTNSMMSLLQTRETTFQNSCKLLREMGSRVEDHLYPLWDLMSALHVMTTGSYRLLPKVIESNVPWRKVISDAEIASVISRLDDLLHSWRHAFQVNLSISG